MVVAPFIDLNGPYSAAPRLIGWLRSLGHEVTLVDLSIETFLRVYSREGLTRLFAAADPKRISFDFEDVYHNRDRYIRVIDEVIAFVQGRDLSVSHRITRGDFLPEGPRFRVHKKETTAAAFGREGRSDYAKHLTALMLQDLATLFNQTITPHFDLVKYADRLAESQVSFDAIHAELEREPNAMEKIIHEVADELLPKELDLVCFTCPFPGNLLGSLLVGKWLSTHRPSAKRALGGGYPSTELREMSDPRLFDYVDYLVLDDGEVPLQQICERVAGRDAPLVRTFVRADDQVRYENDTSVKSPRFRDLPAPDYEGVDFSRYIDVIYQRTPISRLLSEGAWLKLTAAHGCYWKKCTFCDIHLSYIGDFDPLSASSLADQMDRMHEQTGVSGFHFTDEAAPPALLVKLALELLRRGRTYQFWGNVRYDTAFTADRCKLLAAAGMIAVTGGVEIASDALLPKMQKGITVEQVVRVLHGFTQARIVTHAYLIQGFPGETTQDTINSLEIIRQLMKADMLHSAYYHMFTPTKHSPVGKNPDLYGIRLTGPRRGGFGNYALEYETRDPGPRGPRLFQGLTRAVEAFARGDHLDIPVAKWLPPGFPPTTISPDFVERIVGRLSESPIDHHQRLCWLGGQPRWERGMLSVTAANGEIYSALASRNVVDQLERAHPSSWASEQPPLAKDFDDLVWAEPFRSHGLVQV
jgi:radical SAM superfamily enzyme YgiQ (UPF0313 family)